MFKLKILVLLLFASGAAALLLTENAANPYARAYSQGSPAPDFQLTVTPPTRAVPQGGTTGYHVQVTPTGGFTGQVTLSASGLPQGATATFLMSPTLTFNDATPTGATFSVATSPSTPTGDYTLTVTATSGQLTHTAQVALRVVVRGDADLAVTQTASPNPAQAHADVRFTVTVRNNGPAIASPTRLLVSLPLVAPFTEGAGANMCHLSASPLAYECTLLPRLEAGESVTIDFALRPSAAGALTVTSTVSGPDPDPFPSNNTATTVLAVAPQASGPSMTAPGLGVRTVVRGLDQPTSMVFVGPNDFFVLERATGRVVRVKDGVVLGAVLDLAVNSASERGLLGVALHPTFATNGLVYLFWTESATGADTTAVDEVPLLGNRVDRFVWNGSSLAFDRTLIRLRALQADAGQPARGNHNGGVLRFGPDDKLYVLVGDVGRRGYMQNLPCGPLQFCGDPIMADDQFGGPGPDDAHFTGVIFRLNDDGTTPPDNPFASYVSVLPSPPLDNIRRTFAYRRGSPRAPAGARSGGPATPG